MSVNRNILFTFLAQIPVQLLGIVSGIFMARIIGVEGKGTLAIYQANAQLLSTLFSFSFGNVLNYFIPSEKVKRETLMGISILVVVLGGLVAGIVLIIFYFTEGRTAIFPSSHTGALYLLWIFLFSVLTMLNVVATGFLQGLKRFNVVNRIQIVNSIINFLFFATLFVLYYYKIGEISLITLLYGMLAITLINAVQFIIPLLMLKEFKPNFKFSFFGGEVKQVFGFAIYTHLGLIMTFFSARFGLWIINYYLDEKAVGLFSLATNLIVIFNMISAPIGNVLMPFLSGEDEHKKKQMFYKYCKINFTLTFFVAVLAFVCSYWLIPLLYGEEFEGAIVLFQLILPGIFILSFGRVFAVYIAAANKQEYNLIATAAGFVVNIVLSFYLVSQFGAMGAAIATTVTYLVICMVMIYYVHGKLKLPYKNYFFMPLKEIRSILKEGLKSVRI